jgi:superfamily II DNA/RNA helicase
MCYKGLNGKAIIFCQTKNDANAIILAENMIDVEVLHGDIA